MDLICCFAGEDFAVVQQEIIMMKDCKHSNIVAYFGSYLRSVVSNTLMRPRAYRGGVSVLLFVEQAQCRQHVTGLVLSCALQEGKIMDLHGVLWRGIPTGYLPWYEQRCHCSLKNSLVHEHECKDSTHTHTDLSILTQMEMIGLDGLEHAFLCLYFYLASTHLSFVDFLPQ